MSLHLPKPLHGWRAFAGEVGVVVLGVVMALGAGQIVETLNWRSQVGDARAALGTELADSIGQGFERRLFYGCAERRLDRIAGWLEEGARGGKLPPIGAIGYPQPRTWLGSTWQTTIAGQTASHFPRLELSQFGTIYMFVDDVREQARRELAIWSDLYTIVGPGRPIAPAEIAALRKDLSQARLLNRSIMFESVRVGQYARAAGIAYDAAVVRGYADAPLTDFAVCNPIGPVPAAYGAAPLDGAFEAVMTKKINLPRS